MSLPAAAFIRANTALTSVPFVPEIKLYLATEITPMWQSTEIWLEQTNTSPPFWAFAWPGGQALARYVLDHPDEVRGKRVLDFAAGSGITAIAAAQSGAARSSAADIDPLSQVATQINASHNAEAVECCRSLDMEQALTDYDLILAGDVCYEQIMSHKILRWLRLCAGAGVRVLMADPGRAYVPEDGLLEVANYDVPVLRELEDRDVRHVTVWQLVTSE